MFEYVGDIVSNQDLSTQKHSSQYALQLDTDWRLEYKLNDDEALIFVYSDVTDPISVTISRRLVIVTHHDITVTKKVLLDFFGFYFYPLVEHVRNFHGILVHVDDT